MIVNFYTDEWYPIYLIAEDPLFSQFEIDLTEQELSEFQSALQNFEAIQELIKRKCKAVINGK